VALHAMATVVYYISYLIGPTSGDIQEWIKKPQSGLSLLTHGCCLWYKAE